MILEKDFKRNLFDKKSPLYSMSPFIMTFFTINLQPMRYLLHFLVTAGLVWLVANYASNVWISLSGPNTYISALIFAIILAVINMILGTILRTIGFPLTVITLGLFSFIITLIVIWITDYLYWGISVNGIIAYLIIAFIPAITSAIVGSIKG